MSSCLRKFKRNGKKKYTCRKCGSSMTLKPSYGIYVCDSCGAERRKKDDGIS